MMLTTCRLSEIAGLSWREVERDDGSERSFSGTAALLLPASRTKNWRQHRVPLGTLAIDVITNVKRRDPTREPSDGLVFAGIPSRTAAICRALRERSGIADWTWHDLRRTAATGMARLGCPREHVEAALNHISARGGLVGIYQRHTFDTEAAAALLRWQEHLSGLVLQRGRAVIAIHPAAA